jgi:hypothetical protein
MLHGLLGSKSAEKILLFLLVNGKTYATQLHRVLNTPLTPIQKALEKLEKERILTSLYQGKTRIYTFNRHYPLLNELEILLKKAYTLLSPREKSHYYFIRHLPGQRKNTQDLIHQIWLKLRNTKHLNFGFSSRTGDKGSGRGEVKVEYDADAVVIFRESGTWKGIHDREFNFRNIFRWTLNRIEGLITLEHLRFGINNPVFLFHLIPAGRNCLESAHAHLCGSDTYFGHLELKLTSIELTWRILGPKKNEMVNYIYSF